MSRNRGFQTVQILAESTETIRSQAVSNRRSILREEEKRLEQLEKYRGEYEALSSSSEPGIDINFIRGRRGFVQKLTEAIENQRSIVDRARVQLDKHLEHWRDARSKALSLQKYADRLSVENGRREARKEQNELDDIGRRNPGRQGRTNLA